MALRILAFNTVTELCSVAIMIDQQIYSCNIMTPKLHAEKILPTINQLIIDSGVSLKSFDCIVFDKGPGSFIGMRIGINIAQGLSLGTDIPLIGVSSLEILAQGARRMFSAQHVITTINAKINALYFACYSYQINNSAWICESEISLLTVEIVQKIICSLDRTWVIVGTGWNNSQKLKLYIEHSKFIFEKKIMYPDARDMLCLGISAYKNKQFVKLNQITPIYLANN